jgi:hypothetical protein
LRQKLSGLFGRGVIELREGMASSIKRQVLLDCSLLWLIAAVLIGPLFRIQYLNDWMSIEGSFIGDARYIQEHFPHPKWHALWYCGTRFDYIYPPLTRFGSAIVSMILGVGPAQGYHIYIASFYAIGVAGLYFLVRVWTGRRWEAWLAALAYASISPAFAIFPLLREDSAHWMPIRLNFLVKWGEGPHLSALSILLFALGFLYLAIERRSLAALAACATASALVVSNNLYGAVSLAVLFPIAVWSLAIGTRDRSVWLRSGAIAMLAYGLCAWWFTPSFVTLTARNLRLVALPGNAWSKEAGLVMAVAFLAVTWKWGRSRPWAVFLGGSLLFFAAVVLGEKWFNFRIVGDSKRFVPEFDLLLVLVFVEVVHRIERVSRWLAVAVAAACFGFSLPYLLHAWTVFPVDHNFKSRVEYRLTGWIERNLPGGRTYAAGSTCYWYTTWRDIAEVAGGSAQGMETLLPALIDWQLTQANDAERDIAWMVAMGADAVMTHDASSQEVYHDFLYPRKFMGKLPVIYQRDGDVIYRVPRRFPGLARVVNELQMESMQPIAWINENRDQLRAYDDAVEGSSTQVGYQRVSVTEMRLRARTQPGESILVQETWDPGWRATDGGRLLEIRKDALGFMRIQTPPGEHDIRLVYDWPLESRIGQDVTLVSLTLVCGLWLIAGRRRAVAAAVRRSRRL